MKKTKLVFISLILFFSTQTSFATTISQQTDKSSVSFGNTSWYQTLSEGIGQLSGTVSGVTLNMEMVNSGTSIEVQLRELGQCSTGFWWQNLNAGKVAAVGNFSQEENFSGYKDYTIPFAVPFTLNPEKCYLLTIGGDFSVRGSSGSISYPQGELYGRFSDDYTYRPGNVAMEDPQVKDLYFLLNAQDSLFVGSLFQQRLDRSVIPEGGVVTGGSLVLKATMVTPFNNTVAFQTELKKNTETFTGDGLKTSPFVTSNAQAEVEYSALEQGEYHWRARAVDVNGKVSDWVEFGIATTADIVIFQKPKTPVITHQLDQRSESLAPQYSKWFQILSEEPSQFQGEVTGVKLQLKGSLIGVLLMELNYCQKSDDIVDSQLMHDAKLVATTDSFPSPEKTDSYQNYSVTFKTPFVTDPAKCYELVLVGDIKTAGSFDQGAYPYGKLYTFYRSDSLQFPYHDQDPAVKDAYFVINGKIHNPNPIILLPGIGGSWTNNLMEMLTSVNPVPQSKLFFIEESQGALLSKVNEKGYIPHAFENLQVELPALGYKVYKCPYDWRQEEDYVVQVYLISCIDKAKAETGSDKIDIIAHSMGGLVARDYIQSLGYRDDVDKFALVGTPNHGAVNAYDVWEAGKYNTETGSFLENFLMNGLFSVAGIKTGTSALNYIHSYIPSMKTLLPTFDYIVTEGNQTRPVDTMFWKNQWLQNLNASSSISLLLSRVTGKIFAGEGIRTTSSLNVEFPNPTNPQGDLTKIYPDGKPDGAMVTLSGDGTVLSDKSVKVSEVTFPYMAKSRGVSDSKELFKHTNLPNAFHSEILDFLSGSGTSTISFTPNELPTSSLLISLASPAELLVIDPLGRKTGYDKVTGQTLNQIPGAIYSGVDEAEFVLILNPQSKDYQTSVEGNASGEFHTSVLYMTDECSAQKTATNIGQTTASTVTSFAVNLDGGCIKPVDGAADTIYSLTATTTFVPNSVKREGDDLKKNNLKISLSLPSPYKVADINLDSIRLEKTVAPKKIKKIKHIRDSHEYRSKYLDMKFKADEVEPLLTDGTNILIISGTLNDGTVFTGKGYIEVIPKKKK